MKSKFEILKNLNIANSMKIVFICLFVYLFICLFSPTANAASSISTDNYSIEIENIDTAATPELNPQKVIKNELKQVSLPLSFSVSDTLIDFGALISGNPAKRAILISVGHDSVAYHVQAFEDHPLQSRAGALQNDAVNQTNSALQNLPDTTCDNGSCSEIRDSAWNNELTYGFGFTTSDYYKQFADLSRLEKPQAVTIGTANTAQVIFKANIAPGQIPVALSNTVTFIAIPNF